MFGKSTVAIGAAMLILAAPASAAAPCANRTGKPWCDASLSPDKRAGLLTKALTQDEKITLLAGDSANDGHTGATAAIDRVGLPKSYNTDGPVGVRQGSATAMPTPMAEAATFDPEMARLHGATIGSEARAKGNDGVLAPTVNLMRTPLNGRTFEAFGEDPWLVTRMTVGWIEGAQSQGVYATVKHFAANNQEGYDPTGTTGNGAFFLGVSAQGSRHFENSIVDERTLREVYLPQFEAAVKEAKTGSVMCSYNRLNGQYACAHEELLNTILKGEWGFKNMVMSDWFVATHHTDAVNHLNNGLDIEMPFAEAYNPLLVRGAMAANQVSTTTLDDHVRRIVRTLFSFGFFDRDAYKNDDAQIDQGAHNLNAQRVEESAITMLENRGALPLDANALKSIAVIGPNAERFVTGGGSGNVTPFSKVSALKGIQDRAGSGVKVTGDDGSDAARAAALAKASDVALLFVGDYETEGADRRCLSLECPDNGDQDGLIEAVAAAQPNTIVVVESGGPVLTPWRDKVKGLLEAWYPGQAGGTAIARVLFGDVDPGGRLPVTFPQRDEDLPTAGDPEKYPGDADGGLHYKEGVLVGYRWFDAKNIAPAYPFGFGLSYTTFALRNLKVEPKAEGATVSFDVANTGDRTGTAVPQLYLGLPAPDKDTNQPPKQLRGARKLSLEPGRVRRVAFDLDRRALSYWDADENDWAVAPGCYDVMAARSSRDIDQRATLAVGGASCPGAVARLGLPRRTCASRRSIVIHLKRSIRRAGVRSVRVYLDGKRVRTMRGRRRTVPVRLTGRLRSTVRVRLVVGTRRGERVVIGRRYKTCVARKRG